MLSVIYSTSFPVEMSVLSFLYNLCTVSSDLLKFCFGSAFEDAYKVFF